MKSTFKIFLIGLGCILLFTLIVGLLLPSRWQAEARVVVDAEPAEVHALVGSFEGWRQWATASMEAHDPSAEVTYTGSGVGATMSWTGDKVGRGRLVITATDPATGISYDSAIQSDEINGRGTISYKVTPEGTAVTWREEGDLLPLVGGYFAGITGDTVSRHFSNSLARLKEEIEKD